MNRLSFIKWYCFFNLILFSTFIQSQIKNQDNVYIREFKQLRNTAKNSNYLPFSTKNQKKIIQFNNDSIRLFFPTDTKENDYNSFYLSEKKEKLITLFNLINYYKPVIVESLIKNQLPEELLLLPAVCSAFNPYSSNNYGGEGFWHISYPIGVRYGLKINSLVDERRDFNKSTKAATLHLKNLFSIYENWELTLAAYSCGATTINKLLQRNSATSYQDIYSFLPEKTKDLTKAFVAMSSIYPYTYHNTESVENIKTDTVFIQKQLYYASIENVIGIDLKLLDSLNPSINQKIFPNGFIATFPEKLKNTFILYEDSIYFYQDSILLNPNYKKNVTTYPKSSDSILYEVISGDVLGIIADKFNVSIDQIQEWNNLNGTTIHIGQTLIIYNNLLDKKNQKYPKQSEDKQFLLKKPLDTNSYSTYIVREGDNLWEIAKKIPGISAQNIMDFNNISSHLKVGQLIKIPKN